MNDLKMTKDILIDLCTTDSAFGSEDNICEAISGYFDKGYTLKRDALGNLLVYRNGNGKKFLLDAHIDRIGLMVTHITDDGFLKVGAHGGVDSRILNATQVVVHGKRDIKGIITSVPPHLSKNSDKNEASAVSDISIDIGLSKDEAEQIVSLGDSVTFSSNPLTLLNDRFTSPSIDNCAGIAVLIKTAKLLEEKDINVDLTLLFSTREEIGGSGAVAGSFEIECDEAISVDVSFATCPGVDDFIAGKFSSGPMICISPSLDEKISSGLISVSKKYNLPYQLEVCPSKTGTNADHISISSVGKRTGLVSVPLRNMHTCAEVVSLKDINDSALLLAKYIEERVNENV